MVKSGVDTIMILTEFLDALFREYVCKRIIDIGCGTGGHSLRLSRKGYDVTGVDLSPAMLKNSQGEG